MNFIVKVSFADDPDLSLPKSVEMVCLFEVCWRFFEAHCACSAETGSNYVDHILCAFFILCLPLCCLGYQIWVT